jgi:hypothetical protein
LAVTQYARATAKIKNLPHEWWPNNADGLGEEARTFLEKKLKPVLTKDEENRLAQAESQGWPNYPRVLDELARSHHLQVPWRTLPGPRSIWDKYRLKKVAQGFPELPEHMLRDFVQFELTPQERADLKVSLGDAASLERAVPAFFQRKPRVQKQLRQVDQARRLRHPDGPFVTVPGSDKKPDF